MQKQKTADIYSDFLFLNHFKKFKMILGGKFFLRTSQTQNFILSKVWPTCMTGELRLSSLFLDTHCHTQ
jgi:hypothetical protein